MAETQIAVTEKSVAQYVQDTCPALIKSYAVRDYNAASWMKTAMLCIVENKDLMDCLTTEAGRISLKHALRFAATTGLSLNPQEGKAALVPIDGKVNYWPMKNGLVDLMLETGLVKYVRANAVRAQDHWKLTETLDGDAYEFGPAKTGRGEIVGFFAACKLIDGTGIVEYMPRDEVEEHKKRYGKGTSRPGSAWNTSFEGMGIKTVVKRLKTRLNLPKEKSRALDAAVEMGEAIETSFVEAPATEERPPKGTSASDVERELAAKTAQAGKTDDAVRAEKIADAQPAGEQPPAAQASQTVHPVAPGSAPAAGSKDELDIF